MELHSFITAEFPLFNGEGTSVAVGGIWPTANEISFEARRCFTARPDLIM
jgi:hypothetical protein